MKLVVASHKLKKSTRSGGKLSAIMKEIAFKIFK